MDLFRRGRAQSRVSHWNHLPKHLAISVGLEIFRSGSVIALIAASHAFSNIDVARRQYCAVYWNSWNLNCRFYIRFSAINNLAVTAWHQFLHAFTHQKARYVLNIYELSRSLLDLHGGESFQCNEVTSVTVKTKNEKDTNKLMYHLAVHLFW